MTKKFDGQLIWCQRREIFIYENDSNSNSFIWKIVKWDVAHRYGDKLATGPTIRCTKRNDCFCLNVSFSIQLFQHNGKMRDEVSSLWSSLSWMHRTDVTFFGSILSFPYSILRSPFAYLHFRLPFSKREKVFAFSFNCLLLIAFLTHSMQATRSIHKFKKVISLLRLDICPSMHPVIALEEKKKINKMRWNVYGDIGTMPFLAIAPMKLRGRPPRLHCQCKIGIFNWKTFFILSFERGHAIWISIVRLWNRCI